MIQRQFYECSNMMQAQSLIQFIIKNTPRIGSASQWSDVIVHTVNGSTVYYVKKHEAHITDFRKWDTKTNPLPTEVTLNTRTGNEEGSGTSFTHYSAFDERMGINKANDSGDIIDPGGE